MKRYMKVMNSSIHYLKNGNANKNYIEINYHSNKLRTDFFLMSITGNLQANFFPLIAKSQC